MMEESGRVASPPGSREPDPQAVPAASGFDPSRMKRAMQALDEVMDEPITETWEWHLERCALAVLQGYGVGR